MGGIAKSAKLCYTSSERQERPRGDEMPDKPNHTPMTEAEIDAEIERARELKMIEDANDPQRRFREVQRSCRRLRRAFTPK